MLARVLAAGATLAAATSLAAGTSLAADERPWTEIPAVRIVGLLIGAAFLWIAIRSMFGRGGRR